jgi:hypothetical protein
VLQFGTKQVPEKKTAEAAAGAGTGDIEVEDADAHGTLQAGPAGTAQTAPGEKKEDESEPLVLSGFVKGEKEIDGKPAILDLPVGKGRVILFGFNPLHRYLNLSDFRFAWNALLHWNDLPR